MKINYELGYFKWAKKEWRDFIELGYSSQCITNNAMQDSFQLRPEKERETIETVGYELEGGE